LENITKNYSGCITGKGSPVRDAGTRPRILIFLSLPLLFYLVLLVNAPFYTPPFLRHASQPSFLERVTDIFLFDYYYQKGLFLQLTQGQEYARQDFAKAAWYRPDFLFQFFGIDPQDYLQTGRLYEQVHLLEPAEHFYTSWLTTHPEDIAAHEQIRNFFIQTENWSETLRITQQLLSFKPQDPYEYYLLGMAYTYTGEWEAAVAAFEKSLTLKSDFADAYFQLGKIWESYGDVQKAEDFYTQAMEKLPPPIREDLVGKNIKNIHLVSLISLLPIQGKFDSQTHHLIVMVWNVKFKTPPFDKGKYLLNISARGSAAEGVFARLKVYNNEKLIETLYLEENYKIYRLNVESKEKFSLFFEFDNDGGSPQTGEDRNIWMNGVYLEKLND
jgi:tetratricopeptide (TPR) repeat protein